ncbi:ice-binding family protein [Patiriisocius sp. Uisw_017]|jgi:hypothetical protein|uniref:ice-binding family protein n=1 Tax=Patiriisocius sp. Uisw_017 TaxID=3230968 RepID=UPI0039EB8F58
MKTILKCILLQLVLLPSINIYAQVGIGTITPDISSILDVSSTSKGLLMPRLTTTERNNISLPAKGLIIFNTSSNDVQLNTGTSSVPCWIGVKRTKIDSVTEGDIISTISSSHVLVPGMTVSPESGTYMVSFNADISTPFSSDQGVIDLNGIYQALKFMPGGVAHGLVFGAGEVLSPGVYDVTGATSIDGTLTMDGGGDPNSMFIIRSTGAITTGATTTNVVLSNGASPNNIFWLSETTLSTGAGSIMKGTLVSPSGAIALGENTNLEGRMLTKAGGLSIGAGCILTAPSGASPFDLGILSTFAMFTSSGTVLDTLPTTITGDVGSGAGAITIGGTHFGDQYIAGTASSELTTYSIYQNGVEVVNSSRTIYSEKSIVSLQAKVTTLTAGESIEVRWRVYNGIAELNHRTLSLIRSGY